MSSSLNIAGRNFSSQELIAMTKESWSENEWEKDLWGFISEWLNKENHIEVQTSGSTGSPKIITLSKQTLIDSAHLTARALGLKKHDKALLCIPAKFIGGKMMIVRSFVLGLELYWTTPDGSPNTLTNGPFDFTALVPLQAENLLNKDRSSIEALGKIIIGGAPISPQLEQRLSFVETPTYQTFGMTETGSHIALRRLNGKEASDLFTTLDGVTVELSISKELIINAPHVATNSIPAKDLVQIETEKKFKWLGRADNVINSGGIKILPEQIEITLSKHLSLPFFIHSEADERLGSCIVICIESNQEIKDIQSIFDNVLGKYEKPKLVYYSTGFSRTETGKIRRVKSLEQSKKKPLQG